MVVYLDVLIIVNILIDYFLLRLTGFIIKEKPKPFRILSASFLGGGLSLLILLPKLNGLLQIAFCIISCLILCGISFGFKPMKKFFRSFVILFCASNLFGGVIISLKLLRNPNGIYIKNSVVYFNISPLILIVSASVYYIGAFILKYIFEKNGKYSENCTITAYLENSCITLK